MQDTFVVDFAMIHFSEVIIGKRELKMVFIVVSKMNFTLPVDIHETLDTICPNIDNYKICFRN